MSHKGLNLVHGAATLSSCLAPLLPGQLRPVQLSSTQAARLADLRARIEVPFDADNPEHIVRPSVSSITLWSPMDP